MLYNIIKDQKFAALMQRNIQDLLIHLFEADQNFGVLCKIEQLSFEPELPEEISREFRSMTLFFLAGYTFETARLEDGYLFFEAGFGADNFGSVVTVPLLSIMQIIIDETPIFVNLADPVEVIKVSPSDKIEVKEEGVQNSMASFLNNPENAKFKK